MSSLKLGKGGMGPTSSDGVDCLMNNNNGLKENTFKGIAGGIGVGDLSFSMENSDGICKDDEIFKKMPNFVNQTEFSTPAKAGNIINPYTLEILSESAQHIASRINIRPRVAIICGSGLGTLADAVEDKVEFPYEDIPHFPVSTVPGHAGKLVVGHLGQVPVVCMKGRFHFYEGYPLWKCAMPVRVLKLIGVEILIATNAAGGLNPEYSVGDVMLIKDHVNFPGFAGHHALVGPNDDRFGTRFPPMNQAYDKQLRTLAQQVANELGMSDFIREGVYTFLGGPSFETVAELKMLRMFGVDAVGMSTVPEVITARHCGMRCFAFSLITNEAITDYDDEAEASHEEVVETGIRRQEDLKKFVTNLIPCIAREHLSKHERNISE